MIRIAVFCGASTPRDEDITEAARELGRLLAVQKIELVYGGASIGLMGTVADAVLHAGGSAIGVMPYFMSSREIAHPGLTELRWTSTMHERKQVMADLSDAFIALPGGFGTLDELFEIITWRQIGLHRKPIGLLNVAGYFESLLQFTNHMQMSGLVRPDHNFFFHDRTPAGLIANLCASIQQPQRTTEP